MELANLIAVIGLVQKRKPFHYVPVQPVIAFSHSLSSVALALSERWDDGVPKYIKIAYILYSGSGSLFENYCTGTGFSIAKHRILLTVAFSKPSLQNYPDSFRRKKTS